MNRSILLLVIALFLTACSHPQRMLDAQNEHVYGGSSEVTAKTAEVTAGLTSKDEKAKAIYKWITENIVYETETFIDLEKDLYVDQSARSVLRRGTGVSVGYANLFHAMAGSAGIESTTIQGMVKSPAPEPGKQSALSKQSWNAFLAEDGEWALVDPCWGAGTLKEPKTFVAAPTDAWFDVPADHFLFTHYTEELQWQLGSVPLTKEQFERLPQVNTEFFAQGLSLLNLSDCPAEVPTNLTLELRSKKFAYVKAEVWPVNKGRIFNAVEVDNGEGRSVLRFSLPEPGNYEIRLRSRLPDQEKSQYVGSYFVKATQGATQEPKPEDPSPSPTPDVTPEPTPQVTATPEATQAPQTNVPEPPRGDAPEVASTVAQRAKEITAEAKTDRDKAYAIYRYIVENITYDTFSYFNKENTDYPDQSAEAVLQRKTAVCAGYSRLFQGMAAASGLEVEFIGGHSKKNPFAPKVKGSDYGHAWNAVKIDGQWQLLDTTWGAGSVDDGAQVFKRSPSDDWFLNSPKDFAYSHLPEEEKWQLLSEPLKEEEFKKLPRLRPSFFSYGLELDNPNQGVFEASDSLTIGLKSTKGAIVSAGLFDAKDERVEQATLVSGGDDAIEVRARFKKAGSYRLVIFAKNKTEDEFEDLGTLYVKSSGGATSDFPLVYGIFKAQNCELLTGLDGELKSGRPASIAVKVPGAKAVYIKNGEERKELEKAGSSYQINFKPEGEEVVLLGDFKSDGNYDYLLKYEVR